MSKDPAFLFYHQDFFTGVSDMTNEEIGAYIKCMCVQASKGGITEKHMLIICNSHEVHNVVKSKFVFDSTTGLFENIRLKGELEKRKKYSESRSNNRKKVKIEVVKDDNICETYDKHMEDEDENENNISNNNNFLFKDTLEKNKDWKKSISTQFKITDDEVVLKLNNFYTHLISEFKEHPSMNEFTKHFKNWIPVNKVKNEPNSNNKPNPNNGYKPASVDREKLLRELAQDVATGNIPGDYSQVRTRSQA